MHNLLTTHLSAEGMARNTIRIYVAAWLRYADHVDDPLGFDPTAIGVWSETLPNTAGTRGHARAALKHAVDVARSHGVEVAGSPWEAVRVPSPPRRKSRAMAPHQAAELVRAAHHVGGREGLAVLAGLYTAARRSEIANMRWDGIAWDAGTISFWRPKNRDMHTVPLHPDLRATLEARFLPGEQWLFAGRNGGHVTPSLVGEWVKLVAVVAGVPRVTTHILRHTALTTAYDSTGDLRAAQELAGHRKPTTTALYSRVSERRMTAAVEALNY